MTRDPVEEAGLESFPASDAPAWGRAGEPRTVASAGAGASPSGQTPVTPKEEASKAIGGKTGRVASRRSSSTSHSKRTS
jgi:hypothetical protein